jgi:hypothetical protein
MNAIVLTLYVEALLVAVMIVATALSNPDAEAPEHAVCPPGDLAATQPAA